MKWIKGHPYLYEQASFREGGKVRTRHIRYVGKYGYAGRRRGNGGFVLPARPSERIAYVDNEIRRLKRGDEFPFERDILRQYVYHHDYVLQFNIPSGPTLGYTINHRYQQEDDSFASRVTQMGLRNDSGPFTWMHEMGHSLEFADGLVDGLDNEINILRFEFSTTLHNRFISAINSPFDADVFEAFINDYGALIDIRVQHSHLQVEGTPAMRKNLQRVKAGKLDEQGFKALFNSWVRPLYRFRMQELFADAVASLILDPKRAFDAHGPEGRMFLTKVWIKLVKHFEEVYHFSIQRPKTFIGDEKLGTTAADRGQKRV